MLYTLNLHNVACQLDVSKAGGKCARTRHSPKPFDRMIGEKWMQFMFLKCINTIHQNTHYQDTRGNLFMLHYLIIRKCF